MWLILKNNETMLDARTWNSTSLNATDYPDVLFELTISGKLPCDHPIGNDTCTSNKIDLNTDAWESYGVDAFFEKWYKGRSSTFAADGGMMQAFGKDFKIGI